MKSKPVINKKLAKSSSVLDQPFKLRFYKHKHQSLINLNQILFMEESKKHSIQFILEFILEEVEKQIHMKSKQVNKFIKLIKEQEILLNNTDPLYHCLEMFQSDHNIVLESEPKHQQKFEAIKNNKLYYPFYGGIEQQNYKNKKPDKVTQRRFKKINAVEIKSKQGLDIQKAQQQIDQNKPRESSHIKTKNLSTYNSIDKQISNRSIHSINLKELKIPSFNKNSQTKPYLATDISHQMLKNSHLIQILKKSTHHQLIDNQNQGSLMRNNKKDKTFKIIRIETKISQNPHQRSESTHTAFLPIKMNFRPSFMQNQDKNIENIRNAYLKQKQLIEEIKKREKKNNRGLAMSLYNSNEVGKDSVKLPSIHGFINSNNKTNSNKFNPRNFIDQIAFDQNGSIIKLNRKTKKSLNQSKLQLERPTLQQTPLTQITNLTKSFSESIYNENYCKSLIISSQTQGNILKDQSLLRSVSRNAQTQQNELDNEIRSKLIVKKGVLIKKSMYFERNNHHEMRRYEKYQNKNKNSNKQNKNDEMKLPLIRKQQSLKNR